MASMEFGPWLGVPSQRQLICAVEGCPKRGMPYRCLYDGAEHHHGCIHYDCDAAKVTNHGLTFREPGWGLLCPKHYDVLAVAYDRTYASRDPGKRGAPQPKA